MIDIFFNFSGISKTKCLGSVHRKESLVQKRDEVSKDHDQKVITWRNQVEKFIRSCSEGRATSQVENAKECDKHSKRGQPSTDEPVQADIEMKDFESVRTPEPILSSPDHGYKMQKFIGISSIRREMPDIENFQEHDRQPKGDYYLLLDKSAQADVEMEAAGLSAAELTSSTQFHSEDQSQPPKSYQIIFDNLDFYVFAKHMTSESQNKSIHWVNLLGVQDKISGDGLDDSKSLKSIYDLTMPVHTIIG